MLGCGVATGWGAAWKTANVEEGVRGGVRVRRRGPRRDPGGQIRRAAHFAIDVNDDKKAVARSSAPRTS